MNKQVGETSSELAGRVDERGSGAESCQRTARPARAVEERSSDLTFNTAMKPVTPMRRRGTKEDKEERRRGDEEGSPRRRAGGCPRRAADIALRRATMNVYPRLLERGGRWSLLLRRNAEGGLKEEGDERSSESTDLFATFLYYLARALNFRHSRPS